jgi:hypothetical protein
MCAAAFEGGRRANLSGTGRPCSLRPQESAGHAVEATTARPSSRAECSASFANGEEAASTQSEEFRHSRSRPRRRSQEIWVRSSRCCAPGVDHEIKTTAPVAEVVAALEQLAAAAARCPGRGSTSAYRRRGGAILGRFCCSRSAGHEQPSSSTAARSSRAARLNRFDEVPRDNRRPNETGVRPRTPAACAGCSEEPLRVGSGDARMRASAGHGWRAGGTRIGK